VRLISRIQRLGPVLVAVVIGLSYRLWLMPRYAGWEESDYGNLAMIRGVLDGNFLHYDMNHMPGYYALAAAVLAVVGDTVIAARATSLVAGVVALGLAVRLAVQLGGRRAAWWTGALLVLQPEFALYAASSLREPLYAAFVLGTVLCLLRDRLAWASALAGLAFLVRMDGALALMPVLMFCAWRSEDVPRRLMRALSPLMVIMLLWAVYCRLDHGTFAFWSHSVQANVETGLGQEAETLGGWWLAGSSVAATLGAWVLPWRIGWGIWLGAIVGAGVMLVRGPRAHRMVVLAALSMAAVWLGIGFVGQHAPTHNLYWKWLCPVVPLLVPVGVVGLQRIADRIGRLAGQAAAVMFVVLCMIQAASSYLKETRRQRVLSEQLYRPQLDLAKWLEAEVPEDTPMILDNIPSCWIRRQSTTRPMTSWQDLFEPIELRTEADFASWIEQNGVRYVLWFREEWTKAPIVAPFLADGGLWQHGRIKLQEQSRDDAYGWIFFEVEGTAGP